MQQDFINSMMPYALQASKQLGIDPSIIIAQSALETGWGQHAPGNNFFGIKSHGAPNGQMLSTTEYGPNGAYRIKDNFRTYDSMGDSVNGYVDFLKSNPRYKGLLSATGFDDQINELQKSGYGTSPTYGKDVASIAKKINIPADALTNAMTNTPVPQPQPLVTDPSQNTQANSPWSTFISAANPAQNAQGDLATALDNEKYKQLMTQGLGLLAMNQAPQMQALAPASPLMNRPNVANLFQGLLG